MIQINSKADLNRAVANALCPEPPDSERRAIHESGVWSWRSGVDPSPASKPDGNVIAVYTRAYNNGNWEPADFCGDPVASKLLEGRMAKTCRVTMLWDGEDWCVDTPPLSYKGSMFRDEMVIHESRLIGLAISALRALGVEFELAEGWDAR